MRNCTQKLFRCHELELRQLLLSLHLPVLFHQCHLLGDMLQIPAANSRMARRAISASRWPIKIS
jgi:hypothetical protein